MFGFFRVAAAVPELRTADVSFNTDRIIELIKDAARKSVAAVVFPELSVTGASCGDLFWQTRLTEWSERALLKIAAAPEKNQIVVVGMPISYHDALYNCACILQNGKIAGIVPKGVLSQSREGYGSRCFSSGVNIHDAFVKINGVDEPVPFGTDLLFAAGGDFKFAVEIGEDFWVPRPPSSMLAEAGARMIFNLSASAEVVGKGNFRLNMLASQSARCFACYVYSACGWGESTTSAVNGGHAIIAENGRILEENARFMRGNSMICADVDVEKLNSLRRTDGLFENVVSDDYRNIVLQTPLSSPDLRYAKISPTPFIPEDEKQLANNCGEVLLIQASALARRTEHVGAKKLVVGVSGGLDSTLALVVSIQALYILGRPVSDVLAVTMPGFGTTPATYENTKKLCTLLGVELMEVDIKESSGRMFQDIGQDPQLRDVTFENVQARQRTSILMNLANRYEGLLVGTGDLSEIALGWCTFNADHMSMYNVNCCVPKTLIPEILAYFAGTESDELKAVLLSIIETPPSPELLPEEGGVKAQSTEDRIGPYELHDFFIYHFLRYGASPEKMRYLAEQAFKEYNFSRERIEEVLKIFMKRFFASQYKRNCSPDGPRVGTVSLDSRGAWQMPSDISGALFISAEAPGRSHKSSVSRAQWQEIRASMAAGQSSVSNTPKQ